MTSLLKTGFIAAAVLSSAMTASVAAAETIRFAVIDIHGPEALEAQMGPFKTAFEAASGLTLDLVAIDGRKEALEAMTAKKVDFVLASPAEYVVFHQRLQAEPVVTWNRPDYTAQIIVLDAAPEKTLADLKGKTVSFGIVGSTAQHLSPATLLATDGMVYGTDYTPVFMKRNAAVEAMVAGEIAAIGLGRAQVASVMKKFDEHKFRVLAEGAELPNDVLMAAPGTAPEVISTVRKAFADHGPELLAAVVSNEENDRFAGGSFSVDVTDAYFDGTRAMFASVGATDLSEFLK